MSKNPGLNKVLEYLNSERDRFEKAGQSGMFCDSENCLKTACTIGLAINEINKGIKKLEC